MPNALEQKILDFISEYELLRAGDAVLVGFSGGADSTFLLYFLNKFKSLLKIKLSALYVEHNLRGIESVEDGKFCRSFCENLNIAFYSDEINVKHFAGNKKLSVEEAARVLRYEKFLETARKIKANKIATAHNIDDNAETSLLNLIKGKSLRAIAGIPIARGNIIRPILCASKSEIVEYLKERKISFRIDSTNFANDFQRNALRNEIIPLIKEKINPSISKSVFKSSLVLKKQMEIIQKVASYLKPYFIEETVEGLKISLKLSDELGNEIFEEIIKQVLIERFDFKPDFNKVIALTKLLKAQTGKKIFLNNKLRAFRQRDSIVIFKVKIKNNEKVRLRAGESVETWLGKVGIEKWNDREILFGSDNRIEFIDADGLADEFELRSWEDGDSFVPLGMKGEKKISDFLTDVKADSLNKKDYLVLTNRNRIVWLVGFRIAEEFRVKTNTRNILRLWVN